MDPNIDSNSRQSSNPDKPVGANWASTQQGVNPGFVGEMTIDNLMAQIIGFSVQVSGQMEVSVFGVPRLRFASDGIFDKFHFLCFFS